MQQKLNLTTVVVDDNDIDRYMVRRYLTRHEAFGDIMEAPTGDAFLEDICASKQLEPGRSTPILVLMDINMPGLDGFETAERLQEMVTSGETADSIVVMMFTSSDNPADKRRADEIEIVKGYVVKPFGNTHVSEILALWESRAD